MKWSGYDWMGNRPEAALNVGGPPVRPLSPFVAARLARAAGGGSGAAADSGDSVNYRMAEGGAHYGASSGVKVKSKAGILLLLALGAALAFGQTDNTFYVRSFPGTTVLQKFVNAEQSCAPTNGTGVPCILVLDPSLAAFPVGGTFPPSFIFGNVSIADFRAGWPGGSSAGSLAPLGYIVNASSFTSLSSYTNTGSLGSLAFTSNGATATPSAGNLNLSGGASDFTHTLDYGWPTLLDRWTVCTVHKIGSSSDAFGPGLRSMQASGAYYSVSSQYNQSSGKVTFYSISGTTGSQQAQSVGSVTSSVGDRVSVCLARVFDTFTVTANDLDTKGAQISASYQFGMSYVQAAILPNVGRFADYLYGGSPSLMSFSVYSSAPVGAALALSGDSKTVGYYAGSYAASFSTMLQNVMAGAVTLAGGSGQTPDALAALPELLALKPKSLVIATYRNDICGSGGISLATTENNVASLYTQARSAGITPYILTGMYEPAGSCDQSAFWTWAQGYAPGSIIAADMADFSGTASNVLVADNIHPNGFAHVRIYQAIAQMLPSEAFQSYAAWKAAAGGASTFATLAVTGTANFGNNTNPQGIVTIGHCTANPTQPFNACVDVAKTGGANVSVAAFHTNDASVPNGLLITYTGNGTAASRAWQLQTQEEGSSNTGILDLQVFGGTVRIGGGSNTVYRCTTAGTLPVGALTTASANCGASAATTLTLN